MEGEKISRFTALPLTHAVTHQVTAAMIDHLQSRTATEQRRSFISVSKGERETIRTPSLML